MQRNENSTIPTNQGEMSIPDIVNSLTYQCYAHNRDLGMSHESLLRIGVGRESFEDCYANETP